MKHPHTARRGLTLLLALMLLGAMALPSSAFFWNRRSDVPSVMDFSKNGLLGEVIAFTAEDFALSGGGNETLACRMPTAAS